MNRELKNLIFTLSILFLLFLVVEFILGTLGSNLIENLETSTTCLKNTSITPVNLSSSEDASYCSGIDLQKIRVASKNDEDDGGYSIFTRYSRDPFQLDCCANFHLGTDPSYCINDYYYTDHVDKIPDASWNFYIDYKESNNDSLKYSTFKLNSVDSIYNGTDTTCDGQLQYTENINDRCKIQFGLDPIS
tara:strand:- start:206 stop:775 length:570 start_codon:yes stop_codon:yes gene_type:complete